MIDSFNKEHNHHLISRFSIILLLCSEGFLPKLIQSVIFAFLFPVQPFPLPWVTRWSASWTQLHEEWCRSWVRVHLKAEALISTSSHIYDPISIPFFLFSASSHFYSRYSVAYLQKQDPWCIWTSAIAMGILQRVLIPICLAWSWELLEFYQLLISLILPLRTKVEIPSVGRAWDTEVIQCHLFYSLAHPYYTLH